jgi:hypothetical protein
MNLADLPDIFTVGSPKIGNTKLKISTRMNEPF